MIIVKREGYEEEFDASKIKNAVHKVFAEVGSFIKDSEIDEISSKIEYYYFNDDITPSVESIQDMIEDELINRGHIKEAKAYIKYREMRCKKREKGWGMNELQRAIWENKYQYNGEDFDEWLVRVSGGDAKVAKLIRQKKFIFAGRILAHRGLQRDGKRVTFSNCYVMTPPEDNIESIFDTARDMARTYSTGGGVGTDISKLRPKGMDVNNSARTTSGATSFMSLYDLTTGLIGQNGRRGALMLSIDVSHPDVKDFINIKTESDSITKANISLKVTDEFMQAVVDDKPFMLKWHGENNQTCMVEVNARELFKMNAKNNWDWAEAGFLFWDRIERYHLMSEHPQHKFSSVNPCAEQPLMAGGSCLLASINLSEFVLNPFTDKATFDEVKFKETVRAGVRALNGVLDEGLELHPLQIQRDNARDWRQIGLGVMGLADMFIKLGIKYGDSDSIAVSRMISRMLSNTAINESAMLAKEDGAFPMYDEEAVFASTYFNNNAEESTKKLVKKYGLRNSQLLTTAPTGSISTMWGISGGLEPIFAKSYSRKTESLHGKDVVYEVYTPIVLESMIATKSATPPEYIATSHDIHWEDRINMQSVWQRAIDASISSTVNLPNSVSVEEVEELFITAWKKGLKGVTIFRDGCKRAGILMLSSDSEYEGEDDEN